MEREREKKSEILGGPEEGGPRKVGRTHTTHNTHNTHTQHTQHTLAKHGLAKIGRQNTMAKNGLAKIGLAKVGHDRRRRNRGRRGTNKNKDWIICFSSTDDLLQGQFHGTTAPSTSRKRDFQTPPSDRQGPNWPPPFIQPSSNDWPWHELSRKEGVGKPIVLLHGMLSVTRCTTTKRMLSEENSTDYMRRSTYNAAER